MPFLAAPPERDDQIGFDEQGKMFGNTLAGHPQMPAELGQGLAIVLEELIEESAPGWLGEGFKDLVHPDAIIMQLNSCISFPITQSPQITASHARRVALSNPDNGHFFKYSVRVPKSMIP